MKSDRMVAFEAPRPDPVPERLLDKVLLRFRGGKTAITVPLPREMLRPDLVSYGGRYFIKREECLYTEATAWPILEDLDALKQ
jgi:hypothetical protein